MSTDDRDTESSNPSKSFKVGEFDRLSGFFTPVWESKRRLRAESPIPSSSSSVPSSARSADRNSRPSAPPSAPSRRTGGASTGSAASDRPSAPPLATPASAPPSGPGALPSPEPLVIAAPTQRADGGSAAAHPDAARPVSPASANARVQTDGSSSSPAPAAEGTALAVAEAPEARVGADAQGAALAAAAAVTVRPVIPMPSTPGRVPPRPKPPSTPPSAPFAAPKQPEPELELESAEVLDREPELRAPAAAPPRRRPSSGGQRSTRATAAATSLHERLKTKAPIDSVDTLARHRETESEREALQAAAARAALTRSDPYPGHVLRTLRRTIHLSTPLPDDVRRMIEKYRY